jgi:hypothetical protein
MYTPINYYKLSKEGKRVYEMVERYIVDISKYRVTSKTIHLTPNQFEHLLEGIPGKFSCSDGIPFGEFILWRIK